MASFDQAKKRLMQEKEGPSGQVALNDDRLKTVEHQLKNLFASVKQPGKLRDWTKGDDGLTGTKYEKMLQDLIARGYPLYSIIRELKRVYGNKDVFRGRNVLGYVKSQVLNKAENLQLIAQMMKQYKMGRTDAHELIEKEALAIRKELQDEEEQIKKDINELYVRNEIIKNENKDFFSPTNEGQISRNLEIIDGLRQKLRLIQAQKQGFLVDAEEMRSHMLEAVVGICLKVMLPKVPKDEKEGVKIALKQELQAWVNTETRLNKLEEFKKNLMPGNKKPPTQVIDQRKS